MSNDRGGAVATASATAPTTSPGNALDDLERRFEAAKRAAALATALTAQCASGRHHHRRVTLLAKQTADRVEGAASIEVKALEAVEAKRVDVTSELLEGIPLHALCQSPCRGPLPTVRGPTTSLCIDLV